MQTAPQWKMNYTLAKEAFQQADAVYSSRTGDPDSLSRQYGQCGFEKSAAYYKQALQDLTSSDAETQSARVIFYENTAQAFACAGDFDLTLRCLDAMKRQYADQSMYLKKSDYYKVQGFLHLRMAAYQNAVDSYTKSLELYSVTGRDTAYRLNNKALALMGLGQYEAAFACLKQAVQMTKAKLNLWDTYTQCALLLNDEKEAMKGRRKIEQLRK